MTQYYFLAFVNYERTRLFVIEVQATESPAAARIKVSDGTQINGKNLRFIGFGDGDTKDTAKLDLMSRLPKRYTELKKKAEYIVER